MRGMVIFIEERLVLILWVGFVWFGILLLFFSKYIMFIDLMFFSWVWGSIIIVGI